MEYLTIPIQTCQTLISLLLCVSAHKRPRLSMSGWIAWRMEYGSWRMGPNYLTLPYLTYNTTNKVK